MKTFQEFTDKLSIGLSVLCAVHCLLFPIALVLLPSVMALQFDHEKFHLWMLIAVLPTSAYALTMGCRKHKRYRLYLWGGVGLTLLILSVVLGHEIIGEMGEKILTILGGGFITFAHVRNFNLCQQQTDECCSEH